MPEELCRKCGEELHEFSFCVRCKQIIQKICGVCGRKTEEQFHEYCSYQLQVLKLFPIPPDYGDAYKLKMNPTVHFTK